MLGAIVTASVKAGGMVKVKVTVKVTAAILALILGARDARSIPSY